MQKNKYVEYDLNTVTAGDYTVEFDINEKFYDEFLKNYLDKKNPTPEAMQLKLYIKSELERRLTEMPAQGLEGDLGNISPIKIAMISFAYDNSEVI